MVLIRLDHRGWSRIRDGWFDGEYTGLLTPLKEEAGVEGVILSPGLSGKWPEDCLLPLEKAGGTWFWLACLMSMVVQEERC